MTDEEYEDGLDRIEWPGNYKPYGSAFAGMKHSEEWKAEASARKSGDRHHQFGKPVSEETRRKIIDTLKGRPLTEAHKAALRKPRSSTIGMRKPKTEAHKLAMRAAAKRVSIYTCPKCGKTGRGPVMKRHHFEYCRW